MRLSNRDFRFRIRIIVMIMALALTLARPGANKLLTKTKLSAVLQNTLSIKNNAQLMNFNTKHLDALSAACTRCMCRLGESTLYTRFRPESDGGCQCG